MKRLLLGCISIIALSGLVSTAVGAQTTENKQPTQPYASQYIAGDSLRVTEPVRGDLYCAGNDVVIDTTIDGDVLCAGSDVTIKGTVNGDVRVAGGTVQLDGTINGNMTVFANQVRSSADFKLAHDATLFASAAELTGSYGNNVVYGGGLLTLKKATIARDLSTEGTGVKLTDGSQVAGWLRHTGENAPQLTDGSKAGNVVVTAPERPDLMQTLRTWAIMILALVAFTLLVILFAPRAIAAVRRNSANRFVALFVGAGWCLFTPVLGILLVISAFTWPIGLFLLFLWMLSLLLALPIVAVELGQLITRKATTSDLVRGMIGMAAITLLSIIPIINILVVLAVGLYGSGRLLMTGYKAVGAPGTAQQ